MDRRWLWPIAGVTVFVFACLALGWWQWDRAQSASGTARNLAYALEWPSFAAFAIYMVVKGFSLERAKSEEDAPGNPGAAAAPVDAPTAGTAPHADTAPAAVTPTADTPAAEPDPASASAASASRVPQRRSAPVGATPWTARRPAIPEDDPDTDLVSYNRYLAALNAADQQDA